MSRLGKSISASFAVIFFSVYFVGIQVSAQNIKNDSVIVVGIYQNPPKLFYADGKPGGIFIDLLEEIAINEGWKLNFVLGSWNECLDNLKNGKIDLLPDVAFSLQRTEFFDFNKIPALESWSQVYTNSKIEINSFSELNGKRIAMVDGSLQQNSFNQLMYGLDYKYEEVKTNSFDDAFSMVSIGLADAVVVNHFFGKMKFDEYGLKQTNILFNPALLHFAVRKGESLYVTETIDKYLAKWMKTPNSVYFKAIGVYTENQFYSIDKNTNKGLISIIVILVILGGAIIIFLQLRIKSRNNKLTHANQMFQKGGDKFAEYIEHAPYGIFVANEKGDFVEVNPASSAITGYSPQELIGKNLTDLIPEESKTFAFEHFKRVETEGKATGEFPFIKKNGELRTWTVNAVKISENSFVGFVNDITDEKIVQSRLKRMARIFEGTLDEIYLFDGETRKFVEVNKASLKNTGYTFEEMKMLTPLDLKLNTSPDFFEKALQSLLNGDMNNCSFETEHFRKDGTFYEVEVHIQLLSFDTEKLFLAIVLDITERKKVEKELRELKDSLELEVEEKTRELKIRIAELEQFHEATIERELRMEQLRNEIEKFKKMNFQK